MLVKKHVWPSLHVCMYCKKIKKKYVYIYIYASVYLQLGHIAQMSLQIVFCTKCCGRLGANNPLAPQHVILVKYILNKMLIPHPAHMPKQFYEMYRGKSLQNALRNWAKNSPKEKILQNVRGTSVQIT